MATNSSALAWRIPWTEEPGGLQSMGSQRGGHERVTNTFTLMSMAQTVESAHNTGDPGLILRLGRSSGEGNGNPFQYPCLENTTDRGAWQATVHGVTKHWTQLND